MDSNFSTSRASLRNNVKRQIDNPLVHLEFDQLDARAKNFAHKVNKLAPDEDLFIKAARIAWDPPNWKTVEGLSEPEKEALENEKKLGFWQQPKPLRVAVVTLCLSAVIQGWIQSGINGANLTWPIYFHLFPEDQSDFPKAVSSASRWQLAAVNAITYFAASIFGCFLSDPLQSWAFGRRDAILISACVCFASLMGAATAHSWWGLLVWRVFVGLGMGAKASITPIFSAEISPSHLRGALVMNWQQFDTLGILGGFTANLIAYYVKSLELSRWRWQIASGCLPTLCLMTLIWTIPESPRWLLKKDRFPEAFASMCALRDTPLQAARELFYANAQIQMEAELLPNGPNDEESKPAPAHIETVKENGNEDLYSFQEKVRNTDYWVRIRQLFRDSRTRRATTAALVVMISQQLCGMNILSFFSSTFFQDGNSTEDSKELWMSWGVGLANFLFTIPAYLFIDTRGRRFLLLVTYPFMAICMLGASLSFLRHNETARYGLVGAFMFLFVMFYSLGQGPVAFAYSSEVFPLLNREAGMSFAVFANLFGAGILTFFVAQAQFDKSPILASRLLGTFVGLNAIAFVLIFLFVPETAGARRNKKTGKLIYMSLEELNWIFAVPTKGQISYQLNYMLPHAWKMTKWRLRYWFGPGTSDDRPPRPDELYEWVERQSTGQPEKSATTRPAEETSTSSDSAEAVQAPSTLEDSEKDPPTFLPPLDFPAIEGSEKHLGEVR